MSRGAPPKPAARPRGPGPLLLMWLVWLALLLSAAPARAADPAAAIPGPDQPLRQILNLYGKQIPLPTGEWLVAGSAPAVTDIAGQTLPAPAVTLVLFQVAAGAVTAFVTVHTNLAPGRHGWGAAAACRRTDLYAATPNTGADGEVSCSFAAPVALTAAAPPASPAWTGARTLAAGHGWRLPEHWLMAGARIGDREDFVDVRYHFDPGHWGWPVPGAGQPDPWAPAAVAGDRSGVGPARARLVGALDRWRLTMAAAVDSGLRNRLDDGFRLPWPADADAGPAIDRRRQALDSLLAQGRLTPAQYQEQLRLTDQSDANADASDLWMVAAKTVGWRVVVASSVALLSYAFTSSAMVAGGITGVTAVVNGVLYFGHELFWKNLDPSAAGPPPVIDFAGAGITG